MKDIEYLDLPKVPQYLIEPIQDIINKPSNADYTFYKTKPTSKNLDDYLHTLFTFSFYSEYQVIYKGLPIHIDRGNRLIAYNYLLDPGGDNVFTHIYSSDRKILQSEKLVPFKWHRINTGKPHSVDTLQGIRVGISITPTHNTGASGQI